MPDFDDDFHDMEWWGRPQDDPRLHAAIKAANAADLIENPPVNCWIDAVQKIDLYLEGRHRARVFTDKAQADIFDDNGNTVGSIVYLRSETPFDAVETHLGIGRIAEVRDHSFDGGVGYDPRDSSERIAREFRDRCEPQQEAWYYIREAMHSAEFFSRGSVPLPDAWKDMMEQALRAISLNECRQALGMVQTALDGMRRDTILDWQAAWVDCARAAEALRRDLAAETARDLNRGAPG